jgi:hypothetical protein
VYPLLNICTNPKNEITHDVAPVELEKPPSEVLDLLAWAKGHRDLVPARWKGMQAGFAERGNLCDLPSFKLLGIAGDRAVLVEMTSSEKKIMTPDDLLDSYRIKKIGRNDVVFRCGSKEVRYEVGAR